MYTCMSHNLYFYKFTDGYLRNLGRSGEKIGRNVGGKGRKFRLIFEQFVPGPNHRYMYAGQAACINHH